MSQEYNQSLPVAYGEAFFDLLNSDIELFTDEGQWRLVLVTGYGPGITDDILELKAIPLEYIPCFEPRKVEITAHIKMAELSTRIRRIVESSPLKALRIESSGVIQPVSDNDKKWTNIEEYKAWLHSLPKPKFCIGDRVLVTVAIEQIIDEPATVEGVDDEVGLYWCVFDKGLNPQWFTEEKLQARK